MLFFLLLAAIATSEAAITVGIQSSVVNTVRFDAVQRETAYCRASAEVFFGVDRADTLARCETGFMRHEDYFIYPSDRFQAQLIQAKYVINTTTFALGAALTKISLFNSTLWDMGFFPTGCDLCGAATSLTKIDDQTLFVALLMGFYCLFEFITVLLTFGPVPPSYLPLRPSV